ncbi:Galactose mutarotase family enzyme (fragment) [uncultured Sphingopyxis sp.]|uniref:Galactose mutarotase family enzyme n=1 Tax=uncultured Sphingopyxis sp. TaxID=310581 RepID=A0A1Y5PQX5_9SPHN
MARHHILTAPLLALALVAATPDRVTAIELHRPEAGELIDPAARIEKLADGFGFTEGPVWVATGGYLLFSDVPGNVIWKLVPGQKPVVYRANIAFDGPDIWRVGGMNSNGFPEGDLRRERFAMIGPDGMALDRQGRLVFCSFAGRSIVRLEKDGSRTIIAERYRGQRFNGTNDIAIKRDGAIYFTDTFGGLRERADDPRKEIAINAVYRWNDGVLTRVVEDMPSVNGLAFSPDERILYVNSGVDNSVNRYDVLPDGTLANGRRFLALAGDPKTGVSDGMKVDVRGNIYITGPGGIWIVSPAGGHLATIAFPEKPINLAFGGADRRTLFVTAHTGIYRVAVRVPGI